MFRLTRKPLICRLPRSCKDMRGSFPSRLTPSFSQLMVGTGSPDAWHFKRATLSTPRVWLAGPWRMMGGGRSVNTERERENVICRPPNSPKFWVLLSEVLYYILSSLKVIGNINALAVSRVPQETGCSHDCPIPGRNGLYAHFVVAPQGSVYPPSILGKLGEMLSVGF